MEVAVEAGTDFRAGDPAALFATPVLLDESWDYDVDRASGRFLFNWPVTGPRVRLHLVQQWPRLLRESDR